MESYTDMFVCIDEVEKLREEKVKAEDIKDRAMGLLKDKEREFGSQQRQFESELGLAQQQLKQYMEQLQTSECVESSPSVVKIRYTHMWQSYINQKYESLPGK